MMASIPFWTIQFLLPTPQLRGSAALHASDLVSRNIMCLFRPLIDASADALNAIFLLYALAVSSFACLYRLKRDGVCSSCWTLQLSDCTLLQECEPSQAIQSPSLEACHLLRAIPLQSQGGSTMDSGSIAGLRSAPGSMRGAQTPEVTPPESLHEHPITFSGASIMHSGASLPRSFQGEPVQLPDGRIVDSALLAPDVEAYPVTFSGDSFTYSVGSIPRWLQGAPSSADRRQYRGLCNHLSRG